MHDTSLNHSKAAQVFTHMPYLPESKTTSFSEIGTAALRVVLDSRASLSKKTRNENGSATVAVEGGIALVRAGEIQLLF